MKDMIGLPIFMTHFLAETMAFCMKRVPEDGTLQEGLELVMRGVGEIVGGSM